MPNLKQLGLYAVLSYGFVSNVSYGVCVSLAWFTTCKKTGTGIGWFGMQGVMFYGGMWYDMHGEEVRVVFFLIHETVEDIRS